MSECPSEWYAGAVQCWTLLDELFVHRRTRCGRSSNEAAEGKFRSCRLRDLEVNQQQRCVCVVLQRGPRELDRSSWRGCTSTYTFTSQVLKSWPEHIKDGLRPISQCASSLVELESHVEDAQTTVIDTLSAVREPTCWADHKNMGCRQNGVSGGQEDSNGCRGGCSAQRRTTQNGLGLGRNLGEDAPSRVLRFFHPLTLWRRGRSEEAAASWQWQIWCAGWSWREGKHSHDLKRWLAPRPQVIAEASVKGNTRLLWKQRGAFGRSREGNNRAQRALL